jgi:hypothetical protein
MISLHCTQCKQLLEMDEAFAGGVCRCQFCGTIQTVPSHLKDSASAASSTASKKGSSTKALYKKSSTAQPPGTGLDELAEIVASSGLARGSLSKPARQSAGAEDGRSERPPPPRKSKATPMLIGACGIILALLGVVIYLAMRPAAPSAKGPSSKAPETVEHTTPDTPPRPGEVVPDQPGQPAPPPVAQAGPSFAGLPLPEGDVAFLIDRSQANDEILDAVKAAAYRAVMSLGGGRRFQIVFWHRKDEGIVAYPDDALAPATKEEVAAAAKRFEDVVSYGTTELKPTLEKAMKSNPAVIVMVTAKGFNMEESDAAAVEATVKVHPVKIHTFSLGEAESAVLKQIAEKTGGEYRELSYNKLRAFTQ